MGKQRVEIGLGGLEGFRYSPARVKSVPRASKGKPTMRSQIQFLNAHIAIALSITVLLIVCSGCKGGWGRNINPYAAYGSPRIAPPGTGSIGPPSGNQPTSGTPAVGTGVSSNPNGSSSFGSPGSVNSGSQPYYSGNAGFQDTRDNRAFPNNRSTTGSVPANPVSNGNRWRPVDSSSTIPQSRIPTQGSANPPNYNGTQPYTASDQGPHGFVDAQVAPTAFNQPTANSPNSNSVGNGMRVIDATGSAPPQQFTPPEHARPLANAGAPNGGYGTTTGTRLSPQSKLGSPGQQAAPSHNHVVTPANANIEMTQEEFSAFVQGGSIDQTPQARPAQTVAVVSTLPNVASLDPRISAQANHSPTTETVAQPSTGWQTRDE